MKCKPFIIQGGKFMSEEEFMSCMKGISCGDRMALKKIYDIYMKLIYSVIYNTVHNREDAEDIASEFFIKLYQTAGMYKEKGNHKAWLCRIARNMSIDFLRKNSREIPVYEMPEPEQEVSEEETHLNRISIQEAMKLLSDKEKEIADMKLVGGFKFREISDILGIPPGTVSWHYNNALKKLRRCLNGE